MRGLVVVGGIVLILLLLSNFSSAESKSSVTINQPPAISCKSGNGTTVTVKVFQPAANLEIGELCRKGEVPPGWTVYCHTSETLEKVQISFVSGGKPYKTTVVCS